MSSLHVKTNVRLVCLLCAVFRRLGCLSEFFWCGVTFLINFFLYGLRLFGVCFFLLFLSTFAEAGDP